MLVSNLTWCQKEQMFDIGDIANPDFEKLQVIDKYLKGKSIVLLGEQSHLEGTTFQTKYSLIKYLHEKHDFDLLVFESELYGCHKAWEKILEDPDDIYLHLAKTMHIGWGMTYGFKEFSVYLKEQMKDGDTLQIAGFDSQMYSSYFSDDFEQVESIIKKSESLKKSQINSLLETISFLQERNKENKKALKKKNIALDTTSIALVIDEIPESIESQILKSLKATLSDWYLKKSDLRDKQMADNLIWLKALYPDKKIICWGATSHFLYNSELVKLIGFPYNIVDNYYKKSTMMGEYLKDEYESEVYSIGFSAIKGEVGGWYRLRPKKLKPAKKNSLEYLASEKGNSNYFIDLKNLGQNGHKFISRPIGNAFMKTPAGKLMDALIINYHMKPSRIDKEMYCKVFPSNKYLCDN